MSMHEDIRCFDARRRAEVIDEVADVDFDFVVVGGGINGAGIAADAALRGLRVLLLEQRDIAFGTSSRSSKLIHGGLRYLEHYQFRLVFEGTNERATLRRLAPHLVRPLLFALPVYEESKHPLWKMDVGLWMYDGLSLFKGEARHLTLRSAKRMLEREPLLRPEGLTGGLIYYDCTTDDARLTLENALLAAKLGAVVLTRCRVTELVDRPGAPFVELGFVDERDGRARSVRARGVISATGVWTDELRAMIARDDEVIRPTKGVHVVVHRDRLPLHHAVAAQTPRDQRVFFAIPWGDRTVLGTTDTDERGDLARPRVTLADVQYLLEAANHGFPSVRLGVDDVLGAWAGLRPLIRPEEEQSASDVPREHRVIADGRVVSVAGGKLTTYRRMAAETVDAALVAAGIKAGESRSEEVPLPGAEGPRLDFERRAEEVMASHRLDRDIAERLVNIYGHRASGVLERVARRPSLAARLDPGSPVIEAEVVFAAEAELALDVDDVLVRRTSLALRLRDHGRAAAPRVAELLAETLGWSAAERSASLVRYAEEIEPMSAFRWEP